MKLPGQTHLHKTNRNFLYMFLFHYNILKMTHLYEWAPIIIWKYDITGKLVLPNHVDSKENALSILKMIAYMV